MKCLFFHDWAKWGRPVETTNHLRFLQFRECKKCGKVQRRQINQDIRMNVSAAKLNDVNESLDKRGKDD